MSPVSRLLAGLLACLPFAVAVADNRPYRVLESFEVGSTTYVRALAVEPAKNALWVGTSLGVHEVDLGNGKLRRTFTREHGLANEYVFAIGIDRKGNKWFGTNAGGVSRYKDGKWKTFFPMHGLADYWVYSFAEQKSGDWWIGTWAGVNKVDPKTDRFTTYVKELVNEWVYAIQIDSKDRVWFGTEGGVSVFDGKKWQAWTHKDGLGAANRDNLPASPNTGLGTRSRHDLGVMSQAGPTYNPNYVFSLLVDTDDAVWAGTWGGGVSRFDGKKWHSFSSDDGLAGDLVYSMVKARDGALWFGTDRGVSRYDGKTWSSLGKKDGLLEEHVYALAVTPSGDIWAGTKRGVSRIGK